MDEPGSDIGERAQNEHALMHSGVGDGEAALAEDLPTIQEQIQVQSARRVAAKATAAERSFDGPEFSQAGGGRKPGVGRDHEVQKIACPRHGYRLCFVDPGLFHDSEAALFQHL